MAKVMLVNPALAYSSWKADLSRPSPDSVFIRLGLAYLAGALKAKGHETRLADLRTLAGWEEYAEAVSDFRPDILGVSIHSVEHSYGVEAARIAKKVLPTTTTVAGGIHPTMFPEECLRTGVFDFVLQGEGEVSFPELVENAARFPSHFWGETPDLDQVAFPDREIWPDYAHRMNCEPFGLGRFSFPLPTAELVNTRGCPYNCTFCCGPGEHQLYTRINSSGMRIPYIRGRSVENVIAELEMLIARYGIRSAMFHDDQFIVSRKWVENFVDALHRRGIVRSGFKWVTSSRADIICRNDDLLGRMAGGGLALLIVGFESFSPRILRWFNKGARVEENFRAAEICRKHGIKIWANYILGVPTDTGWHREDDLLTVAGALKVDPIHFSPALYTPVPGSKLFSFYKDNGLIDDSLASVEDLSNRGKMATKVKGVGYEFLESIMITDAVLDCREDLAKIMRDYRPEMGAMEENEHIRQMSADAAGSIIRVLHCRNRRLEEDRRIAQTRRVQAVADCRPPDSAISRILKSITIMQPLSDRGGGENIDARVSVVIPVLNGGVKLRLLLQRLKKQKKLPEAEVVVLDSGSTDGSVEEARSSGARVFNVPKGAFSHGGTRQLGAGIASGDYLLFTVQDALPSTDYMLYRMVCALRDNPEVAVVSARQMTNRETDLFSRWSIEATYSFFGLKSDLRYTVRYPEMFDHMPDLTKRSLAFVDNVCACYKSAPLRDLGFAVIENAEDIDIGVRLVKSGRQLGFLHSTGVYHWHSLPPDYFLKRSFIGVKSMVEILGHQIPDLHALGIGSLEDVKLRCATLYHVLRLSLDGMEGLQPVTGDVISAFVNRLNATLKDFEKATSTHAVGNPQLETLLDALGARAAGRGDASVLRDNHLVISFGVRLKSLVNYILGHGRSVAASRAAFADAAYKIAATTFGELLGQWYMTPSGDASQSEMERIHKILIKGVCTS